MFGFDYATRPAQRVTYHRTYFESRLEARWAAFFDIIGWTWRYEPYDEGRKRRGGWGWGERILLGAHPFSDDRRPERLYLGYFIHRDGTQLERFMFKGRAPDEIDFCPEVTDEYSRAGRAPHGRQAYPALTEHVMAFWSRATEIVKALP